MTGTIKASAGDLRPAAELTLLRKENRRALFRQLAQPPPKELDPLFAKEACIDLAHPLARILRLDLLSLGVVLRQSNRESADRLPPVESADFHRSSRSGNAV